MNRRECYEEIARIYKEAPEVMACFASPLPIHPEAARLFVLAYYDGWFNEEENAQHRCRKITSYTDIPADANEIADILKISAPHQLMRCYGLLLESGRRSERSLPSFDITVTGGNGEHDRVAQLNFYLERCKKVLGLSAPGDDMQAPAHGSKATPSLAFQYER